MMSACIIPPECEPLVNELVTSRNDLREFDANLGRMRDRVVSALDIYADTGARAILSSAGFISDELDELTKLRAVMVANVERIEQEINTRIVSAVHLICA